MGTLSGVGMVESESGECHLGRLQGLGSIAAGLDPAGGEELGERSVGT